MLNLHIELSVSRSSSLYLLPNRDVNNCKGWERLNSKLLVCQVPLELFNLLKH